MNQKEKSKVARSLLYRIGTFANSITFLISACLTSLSMISFGFLLTKMYHNEIYLVFTTFFSVVSVLLQSYGLRLMQLELVNNKWLDK